MTAPGLTRRQFAHEIGRSVGYVQKLVDTGRCVLTADGKIDGPASRARIAETQGGRPDVAERFAAQRQPAAAPLPPGPDIDVGHTDGSSRARAKALLMHYENSTLKLEMALRRGLRFERAAVRRESTGLGAMLRAGIERVIDQTAPRLAACSNDLQRRQILDKEIARLRHIIKREIPRALRRMRAETAKQPEATA
jgi:hypothetical protein